MHKGTKAERVRGGLVANSRIVNNLLGISHCEGQLNVLSLSQLFPVTWHFLGCRFDSLKGVWRVGLVCFHGY